MNISILFPGQGSQSIGMLSDAYNEFKTVQDSFSEASDALGFDMWSLVSEGPIEELNKTTIQDLIKDKTFSQTIKELDILIK